jgi:hypothetical protein
METPKGEERPTNIGQTTIMIFKKRGRQRKNIPQINNPAP